MHFTLGSWHSLLSRSSHERLALWGRDFHTFRAWKLLKMKSDRSPFIVPSGCYQSKRYTRMSGTVLYLATKSWTRLSFRQLLAPPSPREKELLTEVMGCTAKRLFRKHATHESAVYLAPQWWVFCCWWLLQQFSQRDVWPNLKVRIYLFNMKLWYFTFSSNIDPYQKRSDIPVYATDVEILQQMQMNVSLLQSISIKFHLSKSELRT